MGSLGWLSIADLHIGSSGAATLWPQVEDELRRDLERVHKYAGPFDLVLCAGDLVQTGSRDEFDALTEKLDALFGYLRELGSTPALLVVPGNHDLTRPDERSAVVRPLLHWSHEPELRANLFWHETQGKPFRDVIDAAFAEFTRWARAWHAAHPLPDAWTHQDSGFLPGDFATTIRTDDLSLGIVGLNSAFLQLAPQVHRGSVAIHPHQLHKLCVDPRVWTAQHDVCFLLTHHPPDWLTPEALPLYQGAIFRPEWFAAHFCGHMHEPQVTVPTQAGAPVNRLFQSPSLLGRERWTDAHGDGVVRSHGFSAARLSVDDERRATLRLWPRIAQANKSTPGRFRLIPDHSEFDLDDDNAYTVDLGVRPVAMPPPRSLRYPSNRPPAPAVPQEAPRGLAGRFAPSSPPFSEARVPPAADPRGHLTPLPGLTRPLVEADFDTDNDEPPEPPGLGYNPRWYVPNDTKEQIILGTLRHPGAPVVVTAPPFSGKSTVLQRIVARLREEHREGREHCLVILLDLGSLGDAILASPPDFFLELAHMLVDGYERASREAGEGAPADTETWVPQAWKRPGAPETRLTTLLERRILHEKRNRMVLAIDRADRFVGKPIGDPMARMLRQWVHAGAMGDPLWAPFRLALAAAGSSLYFYAPDAVSELFASATHVRIESFGLNDVRAMAKLYGARWSDEELARLVDMLDGQPYLCRMILFLECTGVPKAELLDVDRLKIEHCATVLRQVWLRVAEQPDLRKPLCLLLRDPTTKLTTDEYHRLYQAGLVRRVDGTYVLPNTLVASYFKEQC
jgi:hypothetical protein